MTARSPWWGPYERHAALIDQADDEYLSELTLAIEARDWFRRPSMLGTVAEALGGDQ